MSFLVTHCNMHLWNHCDSCFKTSSVTRALKTKVCRYLFPRLPVPVTSISEQLVVKPARAVGSEYVNSFSRVILLTLPTNHDIRLCAGPGDTYYSLKYTVKDQQQVTNDAILVEAFHRRKERNAVLLPADERVTAGRLVRSLVYAMTKTQEVASTLAAHYLLGGTGVHCSHDFAKLLLGQAMAMLRREEYEAVITSGPTGTVVCTSVDDYVFRPSALEEVPHYWFVGLYEKVKLGQGEEEAEENLRESPSQDYASGGCGARARAAGSGAACSSGSGMSCEATTGDGVLRFSNEHPQRATHKMRLRRELLITEVVGPRIPDLSKFPDADQDGDEVALANRYAEIALLLFKPYRRGSVDLFGALTPWEEFQRWKRTPLSVPHMRESLQVLRHAQEFFTGKQRANEENDKRVAELQERFGANVTGGQLSQRGYGDVDDASEHDPDEGGDSTVPHDTMAGEPIEDSAFGRSQRMARVPAHLRTVCNALGVRGIRADVAQDSVTDLVGGGVTADEVRARIRDANAASRSGAGVSQVPEQGATVMAAEGVPGTSGSLGSGGGGAVSVETLEAAMARGRHGTEMADSELAELQRAVGHADCLSIEEVSAKAGLNREQHVAFKAAGRQLLGDYAAGLRPNGPALDPLHMIVHGEGGTGKSTVVHCLTQLASSWSRANTLSKLAPTGVAAINIGGATIHSAMSFSGRSKSTGSCRVESRNPKRHAEDVRAWAGVTMVIIDEVSMVDKILLLDISSRLQVLKECSDVFGGVSVILCGDFPQLPPIARQPLYRPTRRGGAASFLEEAGFALYRQFTTAVLLVHNMRAAADERWGAFLSRMRTGRLCADDHEYARTLLGTPERLEELSKSLLDKRARKCAGGQVPIPPFCPVLVATNKERLAVTWQALCRVSRDADQRHRVVLVPACIQAPTRKSAPLDVRTMKQIRELDEVGKMLPLLPVAHNLPFTVHQNVSVAMGVANGTVCFPVRVCFPVGTVFEEVVVDGVVFDLASNPASIIWARIEGHDFSDCFNIPDGLSVDCFPFAPATQTSVSAKLPGRRVGVRIEQFPLTPALAITIHKSQGCTLDAVLISSLRSGDWRPPKTALYVASSRTRSSMTTMFLQPLTSADFEYFRPPATLIEELDRLKVLHERTMSLFLGEGDVDP